MTRAYEEILHHVQSLSREEQLCLISDLAVRPRAHAAESRRTSILELQGLGKEVWQRMDAQDYIERERISWNG
jgi:hypothetical protein